MSNSPRPTLTPRPPRPEPTKEIGTRLGDYELLHELATGAMGSVWVARRGEGEASSLVALKRVKKQLVSRAGMAERFAEAARHAAKIEHPNVVGALDFLLHDGEPCIVTELLEAETLKSLSRLSLTHRMPIPPSVAVRIGLDVLAGLEAGHAVEIEGEALVHGDLSPENVFVTTAGAAKILDFGLAKPLAGTPASPLKSREKAGYQAPEQIKAGGVDPRADLFAVGVLLWELLAKERLFESKYEAAVAQKVLAAPITRLDALGKATAPIADVVARALQRDPSQRFATAAEMATALTQAAEGQIASPTDVAIIVDNLASAQLGQRKKAIEQALVKLGAAPSSSPTPTPPPPAVEASPTPTPPPTALAPTAPPVAAKPSPPPRPFATPKPPAVVEEPVEEPRASLVSADDILEEAEEESFDIPIDEDLPDEPVPVPESTPEPAPEPARVSSPELAPVPALASTSDDLVVSDAIVIAKEAFEPTPAPAPPTPASLPDDEADLVLPIRGIAPKRARRLVFGVLALAAALILVAAALSSSPKDELSAAQPKAPAPVSEPETIPAAVSPEPAPTPAPVPESPPAPTPEPAAAPESTPEPAPAPTPAPTLTPASSKAPAKAPGPARPRKPAAPKQQPAKAFDPSSI